MTIPVQAIALHATERAAEGSALSWILTGNPWLGAQIGALVGLAESALNTKLLWSATPTR